MTRFTAALAMIMASLSVGSAWTPIHKSHKIVSDPMYCFSCSSPSYRHQRRSSYHSLVVRHATTTPSTYAEILLFNSKSRQKESFHTLQEGKVSMYTCGPTVYDSAHVGNFRAFLTYDVLKRVLQYFNYDVNHVCNLTDIDDKIIARCQRDNVDLPTLTKRYEQAFMDDLQSLNIVPANRYPRATEHIQDMVDMIQQLETNGLAYQTSDGSWYFNTEQAPGYGQQLVQLSVEDMESTSERNDDEEKRSFQDFCLWKAPKDDDVVWDTAIGKGRPGWHLECSAMARRFLGDTIDVHCGGIDLKFPHHENEIAQSEGATGKPFCQCWIHNGFVNIGEEKMSKSKGNFLTLQNACPTPLDVRAYRYLVVSSHYRTALSFTEQAMNGAKQALKRMDKVRKAIEVALLKDGNSGESEIASALVPDQLQNFEAALLDDMSMPRAAASLFALVKTAESEMRRADKDGEGPVDLTGLCAIYDAMNRMDQVFGIFYQVPNTEEVAPEAVAVPDEVMELVGQRSAAKDSKDWELADSLRARITELGFTVKDVKGGEPIVSPLE